MRPWPDRLTQLWRAARTERSSAREIGWSVGVGVFAGCTPFVGFHLGIALGLATLLRLNRLWAMLGSRISFSPLLAAIAFAEIQCAHRVRTGQWVPLSPRAALAEGPSLLLDWALGAPVLGVALGAVCGAVAFALARRAVRRTPDAPRRPSSECPP